MTEVHLPDIVNEFTKICRICLNASNEFYSIEDFGKFCNKTVKISDLLSECTSIEVIQFQSQNKFKELYNISPIHMLVSRN